MSAIEITFTQTTHYSLTLEDKEKRDLADHLDITVRKLDKLMDDGDLLSEYESEITAWVEQRQGTADVVDEEPIEIEDIVS